MTQTNANPASRATGPDRVAFLVAPEGAEQVELTEPWKTVDDMGLRPVLVSTAEGEIQAFRHLDKADRFPVDEVVSKTAANDYLALVLPGGVANPDQLRTDREAVEFVRQFVLQSKPVAVICHGPWTLIEADVLRGRRITSWPSLRTDLINAGAEWTDAEVVVDDSLISSRKPDDLEAFCATIVAQFTAVRR